VAESTAAPGAGKGEAFGASTGGVFGASQAGGFGGGFGGSGGFGGNGGFGGSGAFGTQPASAPFGGFGATTGFVFGTPAAGGFGVTATVGGGAAGSVICDAAALQEERQKVEQLRTELKWAVSDKDRAVTVCSAAVESEKLRSAEVLTLKTRARVRARIHTLAHSHMLNVFPCILLTMEGGDRWRH
jgi:hypothetical protein